VRVWKRSHFKSNATSSRLDGGGGDDADGGGGITTQGQDLRDCRSKSRRRLRFTLTTAQLLVESGFPFVSDPILVQT